MKNKLFLSITLILVVILISVISYLVVNRNQYSSPDEIKISVCDLANNFALYTNKTIQIEAIAKFIGESYWAQKGDFFLEDNNCQIQIFSWAPTTVAQCPPTENCNAPATMLPYLDKKVRLNGILKELPKKEYINQKWTVVGTYHVITDVRNVSIIP